LDQIAPHIAWINPGELERSWHPAFYAPEYLALDRQLAGASSRYATLGTLVQIESPARQADAPDPGRPWIVRLRRQGLEIEERGEASPTGPLVTLPHEAIVVASHFSTSAPATYWDETLFPGGGLTSLGTIVLRPRDAESIAWLAYEISSDLAQLQIRRSVVGYVLPRLEARALLEIKVRVPTAEEKGRLSEVVRERLRNKAAIEKAQTLLQSAKREFRPFVLTAATFEERLEQFESYFLEQGIADAQAGFFVEASTIDPSSDLFVVRPLRGHGDELPDRGRTRLRLQDDRQVNRAWRRWYWESNPMQKFGLFNVLGWSDALPAHLLSRMTARAVPAPVAELSGAFLPGFDFFNQAIELHRKEVLDEEDAKQGLASGWLALQQGRSGASETWALAVTHAEDQIALGEDRFADHLFAWLRSIFRPALALKVFRDSEVAGVYVLFGPDQVEDPNGARTLLAGYCERLSDVLSQPTEIIHDAARRESLRRLSWVMHQLNGPIGRATNAVEDLEAFVKRFPEVATRLVPDEERAKARAAMRGEDLEHFAFATRLSELAKAIADIRCLTYQIRRLKRAQGDLSKQKCDLAELLRSRASECSQQVHGLRLETSRCDQPVMVLGNAEVLGEAFTEVLNNACRELQEQEVQQPTIALRVWSADGFARAAIRDNALPIGKQLIANPFDEDASTYAQKGRGSGLGLAIVRETFRTHGGSCQLFENRLEDGARDVGVTFDASLPLFAAGAPVEESDA
jgi:signal transduction histidine kinase